MVRIRTNPASPPPPPRTIKLVYRQLSSKGYHVVGSVSLETHPTRSLTEPPKPDSPLHVIFPEVDHLEPL